MEETKRSPIDEGQHLPGKGKPTTIMGDDQANYKPNSPFLSLDCPKLDLLLDVYGRNPAERPYLVRATVHKSTLTLTLPPGMEVEPTPARWGIPYAFFKGLLPFHIHTMIVFDQGIKYIASFNDLHRHGVLLSRQRIVLPLGRWQGIGRVSRA